ncbi:hypothetical protein ACFX2G_015981 [Malus domestica]
MEFDEEPCFTTKYFEEVKSGQSKIDAGALLPHQIIEYVDDGEVGRVAQLQWKAMVENMKNVQGKKKKMKILNNSWVVCNISKCMYRLDQDVSVGLGLLLSELNEENAWKGKVINFSPNPKLHSTQGLDDLKSRYAFLRRMDCEHCRVDFRKVFDLILEVAVNENLKTEQMIKRVFVITGDYDFGFDKDGFWRWESDYEVIRSKYKEKGVWVTVLNDFSNKLIKSFLDNDGEICPDLVMEAAISPQPYQTLVVVD